MQKQEENFSFIGTNENPPEKSHVDSSESLSRRFRRIFPSFFLILFLSVHSSEIEASNDD